MHISGADGEKRLVLRIWKTCEEGFKSSETLNLDMNALSIVLGIFKTLISEY